MIILRVNDRMLPGRVIMAEGLILAYQGDSNLVLYRGSTPVWATMTSDNPGFVVMQGDGNLVMYNADGIPIWATNTNSPGAVLSMDRNGLDVVALEPTVLWSTPELPGIPEPEPGPPGNVRKLVDEVLPSGKSYRDGTGACIIHGASDFGGIVKHHENRDNSLRSLDITAAHQQFLRVAWRLNGWLWTPSGLTIDPIRDTWWDSTLFDYGIECRNRGLRLNLSCMDMFNWSDQQARDAFTTMAHICNELGNVVILHEWNEMRYTCPNGENDVRKCEDLTALYQSIYPRNLRGISDPGSQDKSGATKLSRSPANTALVHNVRHTHIDALRRAFNMGYENRPDDRPIGEGEPTGPENPHPGGLYGGHVFQPTENHDDLLGIYTMLALSGQIVTYFNDPALVSRQPLDSTWGFKEIPQIWKQMEIPENVGQGTLLHGGKPNAPLQVTSGNPNRVDSVVCPDGRSFSVVFDTARVNKSGLMTAFRSGGVVQERHVNVGEILSVGELNRPTTVRIQ